MPFSLPIIAASVTLPLVVEDAVLIPELGWILYTLARRQS
jgi:hypothetical protein